MFAVARQDVEITTVEGLTEADGSLGPVQQAFADCHGLQCGFCTPGFLTTITAGLRDNPDAHRATRPARWSPGNLCRCTGYQNIVAAVLRAAEIRGADGGVVTTKLFGQRVPRVEDQRFLRGRGRYVDDVLVGPGALHAAVLRSPHAHARILDIDVVGGPRPRGRARGVDLRRPRRRRWPSRCRC